MGDNEEKKRGKVVNKKLSRKQQIEQCSFDAVDADEEPSMADGDKENSAPSEGRLLAHINIII